MKCSAGRNMQRPGYPCPERALWRTNTKGETHGWTWCGRETTQDYAPYHAPGVTCLTCIKKRDYLTGVVVEVINRRRGVLEALA